MYLKDLFTLSLVFVVLQLIQVTKLFLAYMPSFLGVWLGFLAVLGCIPIANTLFGLMPIYGNDVWLHLATAIPAAYFGFAQDKGRLGKDPSAPQDLGEPFDVKGAPPYTN